MITIQQLQKIAPAAGIHAAAFAAPLSAAMDRFSINTPKRAAAFVAQVAYESASFTSVEENLNYSAEGLLKTWPGRFNAASAAQYARQPEKIANHVYAGRSGNGDESSGDGWKYRGRGLIQVTFLNNYRACGAALGLDLVSSPSLLALPDNAALSAAWFWSSNGLNSFADVDDFVTITKRVNGGLNGLVDRNVFWIRAKSVLGV